MAKFLKILIAIIAAILIVLIAGFFVIRAYLTPKTVRSIAEKAVSEAIQHPVKLGSIGLQIGLKVGITIDDITVPNARGFSSEPMVKIDRTTLNLKLLPLLGRRVVIRGLELSGITVKVERNRQGEVNFAAMMPKETKGSGWSLSLSSIDISKGDVRYLDVKNKTEIRFKDIDQNIGFKANKITVTGKNTAYVLKHTKLPEMIVELNNTLEYDTLKKDLHIKKLTALYDPIHLDVNGTIKNMEKLDLDADLKVEDMSKLKPLLPADSRPDKLSGSLKSKFSVSGTIEKPEIDGKCEIKNAAIVPQGMNKGIEKIHGSLSYNQEKVEKIVLHGMFGSTKLDVKGSIANLSTPVLSLKAKAVGNIQDLESIADDMQGVKMKGPFTLDVTLKGKARNPSCHGTYSIKNGYVDGIGLAKPITHLSFKGAIQGNTAKIDRCSGRIGRSDFSLTGKISNFNKPVIDIDNESHLINLDELLPAPKERKKEGKAAPITFRGKTRITKFTGADMEFKNINTNFTYENAVIDLRDCSADAYDGKVKFNLYYNANSPEPYRITTRVTSISAKKIFKRFLKFENLEAKLTGIGNFRGSGFSKNDVLSTLAASGNLELNKGTFRNFPFLTKLLSWLGMKDYKNVNFDALIVYFKIDNGKVQVKDWALSSKIGDFLTNGKIGLNGSVNLNITTTLKKQYSDIIKKYHGDWIFPIDNGGQATIDILATGTLTSPKFRLDKSKIKERLRGEIKDEFEEKKKEWEQKLKGLLKGGG